MDYRSILKAELAKRCGANPRYSQRAFARDLDLSPSRLSEILSRRYGLSRVAAQGIAKRIGLAKEECRRFLDLVESEHARSKVAREAAKDRLNSDSEQSQLQMDAFAIVSDWYHFAILELTCLKDFVSDNRWIAKNSESMSPKLKWRSCD